MIRLVADSSCDLFEMKDVYFSTVPMNIGTDERNYVDDENLDIHELLDYLAHYKGKSFTACPSTDSWLQEYNKMEEGDELFVVTITSGLSGTYNSAWLGKQMYLEKHPDAKIHVIDSLSTGPEMRLILEKLAELGKKEMTFEEKIEAITEYMKTTRLFFTLSSLHNLVQNGRVSRLSALAAGALNISIVGTASKVGTLELIHKSRGEKRAVADTVKEMEIAGYKGGKCYICQVECRSIHEKVAAAVREKWPTATIEHYPARGLCSFYAERNGIILGCECE